MSQVDYNSLLKDDAIRLLKAAHAENAKIQALMCGDIVEARLVKSDPDRDPDGISELEYHMVLEGEDEFGLPFSGIACIPLKHVRFAS